MGTHPTVGKVLSWLKQGRDFQAASILEKAEVTFYWFELATNINTGVETYLYDVEIRVPRHIYDGLHGKFKQDVVLIEKSFRAILQMDEDIRDFIWQGGAGLTSTEDYTKELVERLKQIYLDIALGEATFKDENLRAEFKQLRADLMADTLVKPKLPEFVTKYQELAEYWGFIKAKEKTYQSRRSYISEEFRPLFEWLESGKVQVAEFEEEEVLPNPEAVRDAWEKAKRRLVDDPDGALTAAVSFLDTVMKGLYHAAPSVDKEALTRGDDLPVIFKKLTKILRLDVSKEANDAIYMVGQGCGTAMRGLASIRNIKSDAHGKHPEVDTPDMHLAELAVNLAGALATFLTKEFQKQYSDSG